MMMMTITKQQQQQQQQGKGIVNLDNEGEHRKHYTAWRTSASVVSQMLDTMLVDNTLRKELLNKREDWNEKLGQWELSPSLGYPPFLVKACRFISASSLSNPQDVKELIAERVKEPKKTFADNPVFLTLYNKVNLLIAIASLKRAFDKKNGMGQAFPRFSTDGKTGQMFPKRYKEWVPSDPTTPLYGGTWEVREAKQRLGQPVRFSRFVRKQLGVSADLAPDDVLRDMGELLVLLLDTSSFSLEEHKGPDAQRIYESFGTTNTHITFQGRTSHLGSCMTWAGATEIYAKNPDKVSVMFCPQGARALLWTLDNGRKVLDRVYPCNGPASRYLVHQVKSLYPEAVTVGELWTDDYADDDDGANGRKEIGELDITLSLGPNMLIPYMDTFNRFTYDRHEGTITLNPESGDYYAENTDADPLEMGLGPVACPHCDAFASEGCTHLVTNSWGDSYEVCDECFESGDFTLCDECGEWHTEVENVEVDGCWTQSWCENCREDRAAYCTSCEQNHHVNDFDYAWEMCSTCLNDEIEVCTECGGRFLIADCEMSEEREGMCNDCAETADRLEEEEEEEESAK